MRFFLVLFFALLMPLTVMATDKLRVNEQQGAFCLYADGQTATICVSAQESVTVGKVASLFAEDVQRVGGRIIPVVTTDKPKKGSVVIGTIGQNAYIDRLIARGKLDASAIQGGWERFLIKVVDGRLLIVGSDRRGTAYGVFSLSEAMGVSPWYWWADVPVIKKKAVYVDADYLSHAPSVKYRGIFINDEDWGLLPWAAKNYEKELGDIGPRTYARVCELLLRLKANMLAPAMHPCTGAFYAHADSKVVADSFGIIITTSHCEPLLLNNAAKSEWNLQRDGEWNYKTNSKTIRRKWDDRLSEASQFENIYTVAMRGLHDEGLRGNLPMEERVPLIDTVIRHQRQLLEKHVGKKAADIPQIFVPYKETMDIYENGLQVPDDITLVWVDDNYGYMKRVSNPAEQRRSGRAGVYYHLSYLGAPHDYLWLNTTPPVLMYEELKKAYDAGADRYWLLNVGDIKPMELGIQTFMEMAWDFDRFDFERANSHQTQWLAKTFFSGLDHLDTFYRLAWERKPEYMGFEYEWDDKEHTGLKDTEFSFQRGDAQRRLADYQRISDEVEQKSNGTAAYYQLVQFPVQAAYQMNRKFLMAQLNHELVAAGRKAEANWAARQMELAYDSINTLNRRYNELLDGKWKGMMSVPPGYCALYHKKPQVTVCAEAGETPVDLASLQTAAPEGYLLNLSAYVQKDDHVSIVKGLGYDREALQFQSGKVSYTLPATKSDTLEVSLTTIPFWPLYAGKSNRIGISMDGGQMLVFENSFKEYSRSWKDQVMHNGATCRLRFLVDAKKTTHLLTLHTIDAGQMVQRIAVSDPSKR